MATTNEQIIQKLDYYIEANEKRMEDIENKVADLDKAIRGNGGPGLRARVAATEKVLVELRWIARVITLAAVGEFLGRVFGLI